VTTISIMGDSISTYFGMNPEGYSVFYDEFNLFRNYMTSVEDTWWAKVLKYLDAEICVNNSYSGSRVSGLAFPSASSDERTSFLHTGDKRPDIILIYIGFNDFGYGVPLTSDKADSHESFYESYRDMLNKIKNNYPESRIVCATLLRGCLMRDPKWEFPETWQGIPFAEYNNMIKKAASEMKIELADLCAYEKRYATKDGTHPTKEGHATIAELWIKYLSENVQ